MENKKPIKKKRHTRNLVVGMPRERPGDKSGTSQGHPGRPRDTRDPWADLRGDSHSRGRMSAGQTGQMTGHGTDGTCPRDRWDTNQGVSHQNSLCLLAFFFPHSDSILELPATLRRANTEKPELHGEAVQKIQGQSSWNLQESSDMVVVSPISRQLARNNFGIGMPTILGT